MWTGGWDSTFQLLQLLIIYKSPVIPFYLIHAERPSTGTEIATIKRIKEYLFKEYPYTKELLKPTKYYTVEDILPDKNITLAYESILEITHLGLQYEWLARLCKELEITNMHLSVEKSLFPQKNYWDLHLEPLLLECTINSQTVYKIDKKYKELDFFKIFQYFYFPLIKTTKIQMATIAEKRGWNKIMGMTWFCHYPTSNGKPCGICKPCLMVIQEGLEWRIPTEGRIRSFYYRRIFWPSKSTVKSLLIRLGLFA